ncbi:hypothetical protein B0H10DRAFT_2198282 [Mycena sp. CBHHK59/15]|nr:hypothetical protein B0H10DRAFT_2198282 [Mycena sp. CBHHK59/15]
MSHKCEQLRMVGAVPLSASSPPQALRAGHGDDGPDDVSGCDWTQIRTYRSDSKSRLETPRVNTPVVRLHTVPEPTSHVHAVRWWPALHAATESVQSKARHAATLSRQRFSACWPAKANRMHGCGPASRGARQCCTSSTTAVPVTRCPGDYNSTPHVQLQKPTRMPSRQYSPCAAPTSRESCCLRGEISRAIEVHRVTPARRLGNGRRTSGCPHPATAPHPDDLNASELRGLHLQRQDEATHCWPAHPCAARSASRLLSEHARTCEGLDPTIEVTFDVCLTTDPASVLLAGGAVHGVCAWSTATGTPFRCRTLQRVGVCGGVIHEQSSGMRKQKLTSMQTSTLTQSRKVQLSALGAGGAPPRWPQTNCVPCTESSVSRVVMRTIAGWTMMSGH